jgi:ribosomal protein S18 acetylase RimI-like enzyme
MGMGERVVRGNGGMTKISIRPASLADIELVEAIVDEAYAPYIARMGRKPGPMLDDYAALLAENRVHVAVRDEAVLGLLVLLPKEDHLLLDNIAVSAAARGSGIGRMLLDFAETQARLAGFRIIQLYTHETMVENVAIYTKRGYGITHRVEERGFRRIYMKKALSSP